MGSVNANAAVAPSTRSSVLVSAAEPPSLRALGEYSALCEGNGVDFLWVAHDGGFVGAQRKEVKDLVASIRGDRIARELGQAEQLSSVFLIVEGDWRWSNGISQRCRGFTKAQLDGVLVSIQVEHGWHVLHSAGLVETASMLRRLEGWFGKASHGSLSRRPKPRRAVGAPMWGQSGHRATQVHLMQSWDGVGPSGAGALVDHFGGVPLRWTVTREELLAVPGFGAKRVDRMMAVLDG